MIKKLRNKFIGVAMLSITLVVILLIGTINVVNAVQTYKNVDERMLLLANKGINNSNDKRNDDFITDNSKEPREYNYGTSMDRLNKEAPYDTRFFAITFSSDGRIIEADMENVSAIDTETAESYAQAVYDRDSVSGTKKTYRYARYDLSNGNVKYIFLDCEREQKSIRSYALLSSAISLLGLVMVFVLVLILSRKAIMPIAESYEKQKRFITDASHEIKTPLTIIDANTEVIEMVHGEDEWTASTRKQIKRLAALTEKLVFLSRMDEGNSANMEMMDFNLSDAMIDTVEPFKSVAATKNKTLDIQIPNGIYYNGNEGAIRQMMSLLLDNAMKYSSDQGTIGLTLEEVNKNKVINIWNTTEPMEPGKYDVLFERFYRQDASHNSKTGGFGIGLSVVFAIVQAHKGKISARSEDGRSLKFTIVL